MSSQTSQAEVQSLINRAVKLGDLPAVRLYADYLRSFRISAEGANN